ncbi:metalloregulator ArsR/SmtB family transcription factor [Planococcus sp. ISL-110]|uniref:ArsR/SmtB family transcription factor n=1 Tax=Planococcus sp. ISL-110 TaxID=2819167 RepID=UPI001BE51A64|nr:metalloregulator ArsR/SmtB family transcription factor [Planococcus sp. ISL-110]MBT2570763.1 helix-turn-helix transcriptional regulator [Planococcus sp. ISL-110]
MAQQLEATAAVHATYETYAQKFKALADPKRLELLKLIGQKGSVCVCELVGEMAMPQSKLSYHLKILLNAGLLTKKTKGTWSYYALEDAEIARLLPEELGHLIAHTDTQQPDVNTCETSILKENLIL